MRSPIYRITVSSFISEQVSSGRNVRRMLPPPSLPYSAIAGYGHERRGPPIISNVWNFSGRELLVNRVNKYPEIFSHCGKHLGYLKSILPAAVSLQSAFGEFAEAA